MRSRRWRLDECRRADERKRAGELSGWPPGRAEYLSGCFFFVGRGTGGEGDFFFSWRNALIRGVCSPISKKGIPSRKYYTQFCLLVFFFFFFFGSPALLTIRPHTHPLLHLFFSKSWNQSGHGICVYINMLSFSLRTTRVLWWGGG